MNRKLRKGKRYEAIILLCISSFLLSTLKGYSIHHASNSKIEVNVYYKQSKPGDTVLLYLNNVLIYVRDGLCFNPAIQQDNSFHFDIPVNSRCGYFTLKVKKKQNGSDNTDIISPQFWERGDSISIRISHRTTNAGVYSNTTYSGRGSEKYTIQEKMTEINMVQMFLSKPFTGDLLNQLPDSLSVTQVAKLHFLEQNRNMITPLAYGVIKANLIENLLSYNLSMVRSYYEGNIMYSGKEKKGLFIKKFKDFFFPTNTYNIDDLSLANSKDYIQYLDRLYHFIERLEAGNEDESHVFDRIVSLSPGANVRESSILLFFEKAGSTETLDRLYRSATLLIHDEENLSILKELQNRSSGLIDDYIFSDLNGNRIQISDFKNKIILIDFWFYGCGACAVYYNDVLSKLEIQPIIKNNVVVLSVNFDRKEEIWKKALSMNIYSGNASINVFTEGEGATHPMMIKYGINSAPSVMLLDQKGKVISFNTKDLYDYNSLYKRIKQLL